MPLRGFQGTGNSGTNPFTSPPRGLSGTAAVWEQILVGICISELPGTPAAGRLFPGGRLGGLRAIPGPRRKRAGNGERRSRPDRSSCSRSRRVFSQREFAGSGRGVPLPPAAFGLKVLRCLQILKVSGSASSSQPGQPQLQPVNGDLISPVRTEKV